MGVVLVMVVGSLVVVIFLGGSALGSSVSVLDSDSDLYLDLGQSRN